MQQPRRKTGSTLPYVSLCKARSRKNCKQLNKQSPSARQKEGRTGSGKQEEIRKGNANKKKKIKEINIFLST